MAEIPGSEELNSEESNIVMDTYDYIDLTGEVFPRPSVIIEPFGPISPENYDIEMKTVIQVPRRKSSEKTVHQVRRRNSESPDESLSIVYENIKPQRELQIVDLADDIVLQLLKDDPRDCHGQFCRKVRIGSKSVNLSVSVSSQSKQSNDTSIKGEVPEIVEVDPTPAKPQTSILCGICLDVADEIASSGRKLLATVCGHIFCCECFEKSMENSRLCPKCRKRLTKKQVHPLYL